MRQILEHDLSLCPPPQTLVQLVVTSEDGIEAGSPPCSVEGDGASVSGAGPG